MDIRVLRYFLVVAREESFSRAAEALYLSQPTLSHHMRILCDSDLVIGRKDGKWMYYSISPEGVAAFRDMIGTYARCDCEDGNETGNCCCSVGA